MKLLNLLINSIVILNRDIILKIENILFFKINFTFDFNIIKSEISFNMKYNIIVTN